jgi:hypothetical protein
VTHSATHEEVLVTIRQIIRRIDLYSKKLEHVYGLTGPQLLLLKELLRLPISTCMRKRAARAAPTAER